MGLCRRVDLGASDGGAERLVLRVLSNHPLQLAQQRLLQATSTAQPGILLAPGRSKTTGTRLICAALSLAYPSS